MDTAAVVVPNPAGGTPSPSLTPSLPGTIAEVWSTALIAGAAAPNGDPHAPRWATHSADGWCGPLAARSLPRPTLAGKE